MREYRQGRGREKNLDETRHGDPSCPDAAMSEVALLLNAVGRGDRQAAARQLPLVYDGLRDPAAAGAAAGASGTTLRPTALVQESYFRLVAGPGGEPGEEPIKPGSAGK